MTKRRVLPAPLGGDVTAVSQSRAHQSGASPRCDGKALHIGVVGAGPRGTILLDRILASVEELVPDHDVHVHLVDPEAAGAGRIFRTEQSRQFLMNTVCGDVTVFTDASVKCIGPIHPGPSQYEWALRVASGAITGLADWAVAEAEQLEPWSYATRAFNGLYLSWALNEIAGRATERVEVHVHRRTAVDVQDQPDGRQALLLDDGTSLVLDALVLATGHSSVEPTPAQAATKDFADSRGLLYVEPSSPADADLSGVIPGEPVLLRGTGLAFFDYVALLTTGRGGSFTRGPGGLEYRPSGREPRLFAGSRRGVPHLARPEVRQDVPQKHRPVFLTHDAVSRLRGRAGEGTTDFMTEVWPLIATEVEWVYYHHLLRERPDDLRRYADLVVRRPADDPLVRALLEELVPDPQRRWNWEAYDRPAGGRSFTDRAEFTSWVRARMVEDVTASCSGPSANAAKAAASALRDLRAPISHVVSHRGLSGSSYRDHVIQWFNGLFNSISNGPPVLRVEQLVALVDSGVLQFTGPGTTIVEDLEHHCFSCSSVSVGGSIDARVLVDAWVQENDLRRTANPLLAAVVRRGLGRPHIIPCGPQGGFRTGGLDVSEGTQGLVSTEGVAHPARFSYGPPIEAVQWLTATIARPYSNSTTLVQADVIAREALAVAVATCTAQESDRRPPAVDPAVR